MAWNGSGGNNSSAVNTPKVPVKSSPSKMRGLVAFVIIVLGAAAAYWVIMSPELLKFSDDGASEVKTKEIKEVTPEIATQETKEVKEQTSKKKPIDPNARPTKVGEVVNGYVKLPSGRIHKRTGVIVNDSSRTRQKSKYEIFNHSCNNEIACYLTIKPGDTLVGTPRYNGRFKENFIKSLNEPIVVSSDDTPEQAQLKRDVIEARLHLKDALDRGEDIEQIMLDTRQELQDLARVKQEFKQMFNEEKKKCENDQDVEDLLTACNKLLEEKGIAPLKYGPITKRNLLRAQQAEQDVEQ